MADQAKQEDSRRVTAILVTHDGATWLPQVVASLASQTRPIDLTIAVDTGSIDNSANLLKSARIHVVTQPRDTGYGAAIAVGLAETSRYSSNISTKDEWIWLIHDDCAPQAGALQALLDALEDRPQVVVAGPKLLGWYDHTHLLETGISIASNGSRWSGLEIREYDQGQHDGIKEVLSVSTAGMLIRRDIFEDFGGLDPNLALFRDDVDFGWRVRVAGHSVIVVTDAVAFHAEAAASERRQIDVESTFFNRPLLLDRRNGAYVLLANSSWWLLPWLAVTLFLSAVIRAIGYLLAKLPGYASDEILAIALLLIHPSELRKARAQRREHRLVSSRVVSTFIPPRSSQFRLTTSRAFDAIREKIFPAPTTNQNSLIQESEDEDLLTPAPAFKWRSALKRAEVVGVVCVIAFTTMWSRHRFGNLTGGALATSPEGASDLWRRYTDSWHSVGMGSGSPTPPWIFLLALASTVFFGKAALLVTILFWAAPLLLLWSMYSLLRTLSRNSWLIFGASLAYAFSPVAVATINSGRLGTLMTLLLLPQIARYIPQLDKIQNIQWRFIFGLSLLVGALTAFSLPAYMALAILLITTGVKDYLTWQKNSEKELFIARITRECALLFTPLFLTLPWSFDAFLSPSRLLLEPGFVVGGGVPNLVALGNPGGMGSMPWWAVSPGILILLVTAFSSTSARSYAHLGLVTLACAVVGSAFYLAGHGSQTSQRLWVGTWLAFSTVAAVCAGVIILDGLRERLARSHFHFRHMLAALVVVMTISYSFTSVLWTLTQGADSPVQANQEPVLPAFLAVVPGVKTLVLRSSSSSSLSTLNYYIVRESDAQLGDADVAPADSPAIAQALSEMVDGSGLTSSKVLSAHGIKYLFMKNPVDDAVVRSIDGLGGFVRTSATHAGIVWRISGISERLVFTNIKGESKSLITDQVGAHTATSGPGVLSVAENFDSAWQVIQEGKRIPLSKNDLGLPQFEFTQAGEFSLIHDGTGRRGWLALQVIVLLTTVVMALPAGRRKSEISVQELT